MVELAIVLVLKQKKDWLNGIENIDEYDAKSDDIIFKMAVEAPGDPEKIKILKRFERAIYKTKDQIARNANIWSKPLRIFRALRLTIKIDFAAFVLFYLFFFLVNCIYWPIAINELSKNDTSWNEI